MRPKRLREGKEKGVQEEEDEEVEEVVVEEEVTEQLHIIPKRVMAYAMGTTHLRAPP